MKQETLLIAFLLLLMISVFAWGADNTINIEQVGFNNTTIITQDGVGNTATVGLGKISAVDGSYITILQQGNNKTAAVEIKSGINNTVYLTQQDTGNHTASIQNFNGTANSITITQQGSGSHEFNVIGGAGTTNSGNSISATQTGNTGSEKWFNLNLNGSTGATVNVQQGGTGANQSSMNVQCVPGTCGTFNFTRN
jgi:hypothetical protein